MYTGTIEKAGRWFAISCDELRVHTQGRTRKEAFNMLEDAIRLLQEDFLIKLVVDNKEKDNFTFHITNPVKKVLDND